MRKHSWITFLLALALCLSCFIPAALAAGEAGGLSGPMELDGGFGGNMGGLDGTMGGPDRNGGRGGPGGGQTNIYRLPREPESTLGENLLTYDLVEQGIPYDEAGLLTYRIENGEATIMSCDPAITGELYIPDYIEGAPVTAVNDYAFLYCANMTALTLPATVTYIGDYAFCYCTALQSVTMGGSEGAGVKIGEYAFYRNYDLTTLNYGVIEEIGDYCFAYASIPDLELKEGLKRLGSYAFAYCDGITQITLPASLTDVGDFVFCQCTNLTWATFPADMSDETMGGYLFYGCTALTGITPSQAWTEIPDGIFKLCTKIDMTSVLKEGIVRIGDEALYGVEIPVSNLVIPSTVEEIGGYNFYVPDYYGYNVRNYRLTTITLPERLKVIGEYAFSNHKNLTSINLPDSLERIGGHAFSGTGIAQITIPAALTTVDDYAFSEMTALESVVIEEGSSVESWGSYAFEGDKALTSISIPSTWTLIPVGMLKNCTAFASADIAQGVERICGEAFYGCTALEYIDLPSGITEVESSAFYGSGLIALELPDTVVSISEYAFQQCTQLEKITVNSALDSIGERAFEKCTALEAIDLSLGIRSIGNYAFQLCTALQTAALGNGLVQLQVGVFKDCTALETVTLPDTLRYLGYNPDVYDSDQSSASQVFPMDGYLEYLNDYGPFYHCAALKEINLPDGLLCVGQYAFAGCAGLEELTLPDGILAIGQYAFSECASLSELTLPASLQYVANWAFESSGLVTVTLEEGLSQTAFTYTGPNHITGGHWCFQDCAGLASINIPCSWTEVPAYFMTGATGPLEITIPASVKIINRYAFDGCTGLRSVTILGDLEEIGDYAFGECASLSSVTLPDSVRAMGAYAFYGCGLTSFTIPAGVTEENFGEYAVSGCPNLVEFNLPSTWTRIPSGLLMNNMALKSFVIPEGIVEIGASAFQGSMLVKISIPGTVAAIGDRAFMDCVNLASVDLPDSVKSIGIQCFFGCDGLTEVTIPGTLTAVAPLAFASCDHLERAVMQEGVETIQNYAFAFCRSLAEAVIPASVTQIGTCAFYNPREGGMHATVVPGSVGETYTDMVLYMGTDDHPIPEGMTFEFTDYESLSKYFLGVMPEQYNTNLTGSLGYHAAYKDYIYRISAGSTYAEDGIKATHFYNYNMDFAAAITGLTEEPYTGTDLVIPDYVPSSQIPITIVTGDLFQGCAALRTVTFGANIRSAGNGGLFNDCVNLQSVDMSRSQISSVNGFDGCTALSEIKWSSELELVSGFNNCVSLASLDFSGTRLRSISGFQNCTGLTHVNFRGTELTSVGGSAFSGCTGLTSISFQGTSLYSIGSSAFKNCTNLSSVTLVEGLTTIEDSAFSGTALTSVEIPASQYVLQPTAFDPKVTISFTGDATTVLYHYIGDDGNIHYDPVLPILLERNGVRIGQFFGDGLDNQDTYFISTESAGLNVPYGLQILGSIEGVGETLGLQTAESAEPEYSAPPAPELQTEAEPELPEEPEEEEPEAEPEAEPELRLYEVVTQAIEENPVAAAALLAAVAALIALGGIRGYRKTLE